MANQLARETSPYLLQHAENPVDWHPWGAAALEKARREDKPIFLSIGYSACHWCHVMAHESFEDPQLARLLNDRFVSIKVDREERPDLDQLYMESVQMLVGHGGWPLSVFLTSALEPFFGGTYWPPRARGGMPGFDQILEAVIDAWDNRREDLQRQAGELTRLLKGSDHLQSGSAGPSLDSRLLDGAEKRLAQAFDPAHGGFGPAPKFPHATDLRLLLRRYARTGQTQALGMAERTLDRMAAGGIYDHLGGGFHRYSTDAEWLVPHFEKMLYDNALLAGCYLEAWQITANASYADVVRQTVDYVLRDMTDPAGGFYSSEDADSEGQEGLFYLWTAEQVRSVLGRAAGEMFSNVYDVSEAGNFEGRNILHRPKSIVECAILLGREPAELSREQAESRRKLLGAREKRVRPGRDDKVLTGWNGLMIESLARAGTALAEDRYLDAARRAALFLLQRMRDAEGRLLRSWRQGQARFPAYLEDHAALCDALVSLYEASFEERWIDEALRLADAILARFLDRDRGGFFFTASDQEAVLTRKKDVLDNATPGGGSLAITAMVRLGKLCGRRDYLEAAESSLKAAAALMAQVPSAAGQSLLALDTLLGPSPELVLLGDGDEQTTGKAIGQLHRVYVPGRVTACRLQSSRSGLSQELSGIFAGKRPAASGPTLFVCEDFACQSPVSGPAVLESLERLATVPARSQSAR